MENTDYSKYTVLVVDDIPVNIMLIKGMLAGMKFNLISANSGQEAIEKATNEKPDVILMDVLMPGMNGYDCTRVLRSNPATSDIPVVIVSALSSDSDMKEGLAAGANDFLTKPIIKERIVNCILNQINLSESAKMKDGTLTFNDKSMRDGITSVLTYMAGGINQTLMHDIALLTAGIPMSLIDNTLNDTICELVEHHVDDEQARRTLTAWAAERIKTKDVINKKISLHNILVDLTSKLLPLFKEKQLSLAMNISETVHVSLDPELFWALVINMFVSISNISSRGKLDVSTLHEEGLLTLSITAPSAVEGGAEKALNMQIAVQIAEKLGGALVSNQLTGETLQLQLIVPV